MVNQMCVTQIWLLVAELHGEYTRHFVPGGLGGAEPVYGRKPQSDRRLEDRMSWSRRRLPNPKDRGIDMKLPIFALVSAAVLGQGVSAQAETTFGQALMNRLTGVAASEAKSIEVGPTLLLSDLEQAQADQSKTGVVPVGYDCAEPSCAAGCDSGCDSWFNAKMCPGTGAFGGDSRFAASLGFNHDVFFGNYTTLFAGYAINERVDVTFYSILWHTDFFSQFGLGNGSQIPGTGLWTEFGAGLNFKLMDGALNVNPQFGILNGALLSGFGDPKVFDGVVPNLTVSYDETFVESEFYMGYYVGVRGVTQNDYLHWWYNFGVKPWGDCNDWKSILSTGIHYEMLRQTEGGNAPINLYSWIGPYFQVALPNGLGMRYSAGWNVDDNVGLGRNFYKVNLTYDF